MAQAPASVFAMDVFVQTTGYFTLTTPSGSYLSINPKPPNPNLETATGIDAEQFTSQDLHTFQFILRNSATAQEAPTLSLDGNLDYLDFIHVVNHAPLRIPATL